jgi:hypothetical protein
MAIFVRRPLTLLLLLLHLLLLLTLPAAAQNLDEQNAAMDMNDNLSSGPGGVSEDPRAFYDQLQVFHEKMTCHISVT